MVIIWWFKHQHFHMDVVSEAPKEETHVLVFKRHWRNLDHQHFKSSDIFVESASLMKRLHLHEWISELVFTIMF